MIRLDEGLSQPRQRRACRFAAWHRLACRRRHRRQRRAPNRRGATRYHQIPSECWVIIIRPPTPWGRLLYSSLPALPPRLSKVDVALHSTAGRAAVLKILSTNDAQPLITKVALKMILELWSVNGQGYILCCIHALSIFRTYCCCSFAHFHDLPTSLRRSAAAACTAAWAAGCAAALQEKAMMA